MESFEYVVVLTSLILGLAMAQILNGVSDMVAHYSKIKFSFAHTILIVIIFFVTIQDWFYSYQYSKQIEEWTMPTVLSILSFPILLFIEARILFPTGTRSKEVDMDVYFYDNWKWLYTLFTMTIIVSILQNIFFSGFTIIEQVPLMLYAGVYLLFIFGDFKNKLYHDIFMVAQLFVWLSFFILEKSTL
ncbi:MULTISPECIES: hypothetical protein [Reichenbachiella]|uniref:Uncharacterized protein n=1 Tax=Reichenbachiella agariperforans TaxID=156994 RepID=A0A1M6QJC3_REIAG|nr:MULTISPECIES: hypothetical protein [Reichenbachiella]RJE73111.1 hypothetical protein BGP76_03995 [Reichenbachiella sp. MSK19-1]SHK20341.1 hypothetical protein SAMN04488028_103352 [Reichenbachiella agariperforans]